MIAISDIDPARPVVIAGPTACGKSALALDIAKTQGGVIINADAIQVYDNWRILTARPTVQDEAAAPHALYGHVPGHQPYSVGQWLRDLDPLLRGPDRPIIVGGTGLYLTALTEGLADIPETPASIRAEADARLREHGLGALLGDIDPDTQSRIDRNNPMRVQRAWEVQATTGIGLAAWQDDTPPPRLPVAACQTFLFDAPKDWLTPRIETRFARMIALGALDEARANLPTWSPHAPSSKAIGAAELIAHLQGRLSLDAAITRAGIATRQFAKRQRSWFRARMGHWPVLRPESSRA